VRREIGRKKVEFAVKKKTWESRFRAYFAAF